MKRALHTLLLFGVPLLLSASYVPVGLKGYNADIVLTPYEDGNDSFLDDGWCFYSDNRTARGGLPEKIRGLFSDVPYRFNDFNDKCAFCLSSIVNDQTALKYGRSITIDFNEPQSARSLWILGTSGVGNAEISVTVNYSDGTSDDKQL